MQWPIVTHMKKTILSIIIVLTILSCSTTKTVENKKKTDSLNEKPITYDYADKIGSEKFPLGEATQYILTGPREAVRAEAGPPWARVTSREAALHMPA